LDVSNRHFPTIKPIPRTRELGRVVEAFNTLSAAMRKMLADSEKVAERFRNQTLTDALTGIGNRRSLVANIEMLLESPLGEHTLAFIQVGGLAELNKTDGHARGDKFVIALVNAIMESPRISFLARLQGSTFAMVLESTSETTLKVILDTTCRRLEHICREFHLSDEVHCSAGAVRLFYNHTSSEALAKVDEVLARALKSGQSEIDLIQGPGLPSSEWKNFLMEAMAGNRFILCAQQVVKQAGDNSSAEIPEVLHSEVFSRLIDSDGMLIPAGRFIPMAVRHDLVTEIDRHCLINLTHFMSAARLPKTRYAFNISQNTFLDPAFPEWISHQLDVFELNKDDLILEIGESLVLASPHEAERFANALKHFGMSFGIDQFGLQKATVTELAELQPAYFKLATDLTRHCADVDEYGEYIAWLVKTSEILGIPVIATCVEKKEWLERLLKAGVVGFQGQLIGPTTFLENPQDIENI
jgi:EAL domain-containing protein (putative c-di-GMP-specific phosphodiesterase class I)/GGDEF domain-containing protein